MGSFHQHAITITLGLIALGILMPSSSSADPRIADIVQSGKIRVPLFIPQYSKTPGGQIKGIGVGAISIGLFGDLAERLRVQLTIMEFPTPPRALQCLQSRQCDAMLIGMDTSRLAQVDFAAEVAQFDFSYLVPMNSMVLRSSDLDQPGVRIAVVDGHASALAVRRIVKRAEFVGADLPDESFELLRTGKADVFAFPRSELIDYAAKLPGSRVFAEGYAVNRVGLALAKGQAERLAYMAEFVEAAERTGLIQRILDREGLGARGFKVGSRDGGPSK
jgi:polar amino acid transport system substrate-binding protein